MATGFDIGQARILVSRDGTALRRSTLLEFCEKDDVFVDTAVSMAGYLVLNGAYHSQGLTLALEPPLAMQVAHFEATGEYL